MDTPIYGPREDSFLLQRYVEKFSFPGSMVLDMGTGTGIQAFTAAKAAKQVTAADINPEAVKYVKEEIRFCKINNVKVIQTDLFEKVKGRFDLIIFNPPYLPEEKEIENAALFSAKRGTETTTRFISQARDYLNDSGVILITGSSLAKQALIDETISKYLLESEILERMHVFFEDIYVMKIVKSQLLKDFESKKIMEPVLFAKGKRGVIIKARYRKKDVAVKIKKESSAAMGTVENEKRILKILNRKSIGPKLIEKDFLMYEFVNGIFIFDYIRKSSRSAIIKVLTEIFSQLYTMDRLGINKFEMHHPIKHILIDKKPVLIDFERARYTQDPKNVTQFCDFLMGDDMSALLAEKGILIDKDNLIEYARTYKSERTLVNYRKILEILKPKL